MAVLLELEIEALDLLITKVGPIFQHIVPHWPVLSIQLRCIDFEVLPSTSSSIAIESSIAQQKLGCGFIQHDPVLDSSTLPIRISCMPNNIQEFLRNECKVNNLC